MADIRGAAYPRDVDRVPRQQLAHLGVAPALNERHVSIEPCLQVPLPLRQKLPLILKDDRRDAELERGTLHLGGGSGKCAAETQRRDQPTERMVHGVLRG